MGEMNARFSSILVANRGEIAARVLRTAKDLGYRTVAVYSEADAAAPHLRLADDRRLIGPPPASESYLDIERIIDAAKQSGADAIHPGYGFLSENAEFVTACENADIVFIGPGAKAIALMGNKAEAKRHMANANVPCVPGYEGKEQSDDVFVQAATDIGYPVMVKAAAGGGGRGMRLVDTPDELPGALNLARSEAQSAFGSDELILEKAVQSPRHVEVQVFADTHGNVIHLGERDCSVQRRHQKIVEESPCPIMTSGLRERMGQAAVDAARSIGYVGAGTVEFLLDTEGEFYFLEMNTRLQVEHPVTEMITGLDLVQLQIETAQGRELPLTQDDVVLNGHAIEVRLYAEDPHNGFLPSTGEIALWQCPAGAGIRVDDGIETGGEVLPWYDPLLAKIIAHGETREEARTRLVDALGSTALFGPTTNRDFLIRVLKDETFASGEATTALLDDTSTLLEPLDEKSTQQLAATAAVLAYRESTRASFADAVRVPPELREWSSAGQMSSRFQLAAGNQVHQLVVSPCGNETYAIAETALRLTDETGNRFAATVADEVLQGHYLVTGQDQVFIATPQTTQSFSIGQSQGDSSDATAGGNIVSPMHGQLLELCIAEGDTVRQGQRLAVLEAMKMQHEIRAEVDGVVKSLHHQAGAQIAAHDLIIEIEQTEQD